MFQMAHRKCRKVSVGTMRTDVDHSSIALSTAPNSRNNSTKSEHKAADCSTNSSLIHHKPRVISHAKPHSTPTLTRNSKSSPYLGIPRTHSTNSNLLSPYMESSSTHSVQTEGGTTTASHSDFQLIPYSLPTNPTPTSFHLPEGISRSFHNLFGDQNSKHVHAKSKFSCQTPGDSVSKTPNCTSIFDPMDKKAPGANVSPEGQTSHPKSQSSGNLSSPTKLGTFSVGAHMSANKTLTKSGSDYTIGGKLKKVSSLYLAQFIWY